MERPSTVHRPTSEPPTALPAADDCRCLCGSLLARLVAGGVELKCRRCKRTLFVPVAEAMAGDVATLPLPVREAG